MENQNRLFREKSLERISSPESLNDYLHVTSPAVWLILSAVILLLAGMLVWSHFATIDSFASGTARVESGTMYIQFDNAGMARHVESGMTVISGTTETNITSVGTDDRGELFALAPTALADGNYNVRVRFRRTKLIQLLFN